jgi:peptidoglycan/LPS O-acetylase OafA/YrhL
MLAEVVLSLSHIVHASRLLGDAVERLQRIQYLRGIAALLVLLSHVDGVTKSFVDHDLVVTIGSAFNGTFGVDIFFVISGFIMVYTCRNSFGDPGAVGSFLWRRLTRIAPIYWVMTTVEAGILFLSRLDDPGHQITLKQLVLSFLFIPYDWHDDKFRPLLGPGWSLNYEMFFYVVFAATLFLTMRRALVALAAIFVGLALIGLLSPPGAVLMAWTRPIILEFLAGGLLAGAYCWLDDRRALPAFKWPMLLVALFVVIQAILPNDTDRLSAWNWSSWLLAILIVASATLLAAPNANTLVSRAMVMVGNASYSLYLTHVIVLALLATAWKKVGAFGSVGLVAFLVVGLVSTLAAGWLSYTLIELPLTNALKRLRPGRSRLAVVPS